MDRDVLHINVSAFPIGVERVMNSALRERPVVIAPASSVRAVALAVSREAYLEGVRKGMPVTSAKKFCRGLIVIPPNEPLYRRASAAVLDYLDQYSPLIEPWRAGHLYLDLTGTRRLFGPPVDTGAKIQKELKARFSLRSAVGLASNKLVSRVASRVIRPRGVCDVFPGGEGIFLAPLPVEVLPGLDEKAEATLSDLNLARVGELAALPPEHLVLAFGPFGYRLHRFARGRDDSPVRPAERAPVIREEETLAEDSNDDRVILGVLYLLVERAARRLRQIQRLAGAVRLEITYADHVSVSRQARLAQPGDLDGPLFDAARHLLESAWTRRTRLRYLGLSLKDLVEAPRQLRLFAEDQGQERALVSALDQLRRRFGETAVRHGRVVGSRQ
jgi:DNA polymerase IV